MSGMCLIWIEENDKAGRAEVDDTKLNLAAPFSSDEIKVPFYDDDYSHDSVVISQIHLHSHLAF